MYFLCLFKEEGDSLEIFKLFGRILVDDGEAQKSISKTEKSSQSLGDKMRSGIKTAAKWGVALVGGATAIGGAMFGLALKAGRTADELLDLSAVTGMSTDELQRWRKVAVVAGTSQDAIADASAKLTKSLDAMSSESNKGNKALTKLGVSLEEIEGMNADQRMDTLTKALSEIDDETERARVGTELFGGSWKDIAPIVDLGAEAMDKAKESAKVFSEDELTRANDFRIMVDDIKDRFGNFAMEIGIKVLPILETFFEWVENAMPTIQEIFDTVFSFIGELFTIAGEWIGELISTIQSWVENNSESLSEIWNIYQTYWGLIWEYIEEVFGYIWEIIQHILGLILPYVEEVLGKIQEFWSENGEKIMEAVQNAFEFIQDIIEEVMPIITEIIDGAWEIISSIFDTAIGIVMGLVETFSSLLTGDFEGIKEGLTRIWDSLWEGIEGVVSGAWNLVSGAFSGLWDSISGWFTGLKDDAIEWGKNMIKGFIDGIKGMYDNVKNAVTGVMDKVKGFLGFNSPAKEGEGRHIVEWGSNMIDGFLDGVNKMVPEAEITMNKVVENMQPDHLGVADTKSDYKSESDFGLLAGYLQELIEAVKEGQDIIIGDKVIAKVTGDARNEYDGKRVRRVARGLAT